MTIRRRAGRIPATPTPAGPPGPWDLPPPPARRSRTGLAVLLIAGSVVAVVAIAVALMVVARTDDGSAGGELAEADPTDPVTAQVPGDHQVTQVGDVTVSRLTGRRTRPSPRPPGLQYTPPERTGRREAMADTCAICGDRPHRRPGRSWCEGCSQAYHRGYQAADRK